MSIDLPAKLRSLSEYSPKQDYWLSVMANYLVRMIPEQVPIVVNAEELQGLLGELSKLGQQLHRECRKGWIRNLFTFGDPESKIHQELSEIAKTLYERHSGKRFPDLATL